MTPNQKTTLIAHILETHGQALIDLRISYGVHYTLTYDHGLVVQVSRCSGYGGFTYGLILELGVNTSRVEGPEVKALYDALDARDDDIRRKSTASQEAKILTHLGIPTTQPT